MIRIACLTHEGETFFARCERSPGEPDSAILRLVLGIHELRPAMARKILRNPVRGQGRAHELDFGALKVGAKRLRQEVVDPAPDWVEVPLLAAEPPTTSPSSTLPIGASDAAWMEVADSLARSVPRPTDRPRYEQSRPVGAVLVSKDGELLARAANGGARNRMLHAELQTLRAWYSRTRKPIPRGARLIVTLKPCKLCAGAIWECAEDVADLRVVYRDPDPGPMGRLTVLDPESFERERASAGSPALRGLEIQHQHLPG